MLAVTTRLAVWLFSEDPAESTIDTEVAESANPVLPVVPEILWALGSFLVLAALMMWVAVPMVKRGMDAREKKVTEDNDEADRMQAELDELVANYKQKLAEAQAEAARILDEVRNEANESQRAARAETEAELGELRRQTMAEIATAKSEAMDAIRTEVDAMAIDLAEKVVAQPLDRSKATSSLNQEGAK